ncbi:MAG: hypothetical protein H7A24_00775 [Leptospiraceae bacterium]|nr:hypothetical protein [Leptospiraceae bacterium]MCP5510384.1 hypothetical protein [Leptospiraceae bacterium]
MNRSKHLFLILPLLLILNCTIQKIEFYPDKEIDYSHPRTSIKSNFIFWGFFQSRQIDLIEECIGDLPIAVLEKQTYADAILSFFTVHIYSPRTSYIYCEEVEK